MALRYPDQFAGSITSTNLMGRGYPMFKRIIALLIAGLVINLVCAPATAVGQQTGSDARAEKMKAKVIEIGTGSDARVEVRLNDGRRVKGYISESKDDYFTVVDDKAGVATRIDYSQAQKISVQKHISPEAKRMITGAVLLGMILFFGILAARS
jgi:hypothetical protein